MTDILLSEYSLAMFKGCAVAMTITNALALAGALDTGLMYLIFAVGLYVSVSAVERYLDHSEVSDYEWE